MKNKPMSDAADTAERVQENVSNLPILSVALAGLLGAGTFALWAIFARRGHM